MTAIAKPTPTGEKTLRQSRYGVFDLLSLFELTNSWAREAAYATYRRMRRDPTIALARAIATMPIRKADWSFEADDGVPDQWIDTVRNALDRHLRTLIIDLTRSLDFGWQSFEVVWQIKNGALDVERFKPLLHDITEILIEAKSGRLFGVLNTGERLEVGRNCLLYTYDGEAQNYYGRSRMENIREYAHEQWIGLSKKAEMYFGKAAGVLPVVHYPPGVAQTESGTIDNADVAEGVLNALGTGKGVTIPWELAPWAEEALNRGADPSKLAAWTIEFMETDSGHGEEFLGHLRYRDSLKFRGWLVPERAGIEGQQGTKAEAETHGDIVIDIAQEELGLYFREINRQVVNTILTWHFGPAAADKVRVMPAPIIDEDREFVRNLVGEVLKGPGNLDLMLGLVDFDAMLDESGVPKAQQVVDPVALREIQKAQQPDPNDPNANPNGPRPPFPQAIEASRRELLGAMLSRLGMRREAELLRVAKSAPPE